LPMEIRVPSLGVAIQEVTIAMLHVSVGDHVTKGDVLAEVVSEKVSFEIVAPEDGYISEIRAAEGDRVAVGSVLAVMGSAPGVPTQVTPPKRIEAAPAARALLKEYQLDPSTIRGSGPGGMITKNDVLRAMERERREGQAVPETVDSKTADQETFIPGTGLLEERIAMTPMRSAIAENMVFSKNMAAHVTTVAEVDLTEVLDLRQKLQASLGEGQGQGTSVVSFVCRAMVEAIREFPVINASLEGNYLVLKKYVNIGVAVAVENGLVVPVIRDADKKSFLDLDSELRDLTLQARAGKLRGEQLQGGTISLSNAGTFGAVIATPIINQPQSAIVWMGKAVKRPVVVEDQIVIRSMIYLCVSYDHRVLDGALAARFLQRMRRELENPLALVAR